MWSKLYSNDVGPQDNLCIVVLPFGLGIVQECNPRIWLPLARAWLCRLGNPHKWLNPYRRWYSNDVGRGGILGILVGLSRFGIAQECIQRNTPLQFGLGNNRWGNFGTFPCRKDLGIDRRHIWYNL